MNYKREEINVEGLGCQKIYYIFKKKEWLSIEITFLYVVLNNKIKETRGAKKNKRKRETLRKNMERG